MKKTFTLVFIFLFTGAFATQFKSTIQLELQSETTGYWDQTSVFFDKNISPLYVPNQDDAKIFSNVPGVPNFFSYTSDMVSCSINGAGDLSSTEVVELGYNVQVSGMYKIAATIIDNFDPTCIMRLEDRKLGVFTDLRANFYQVQLNDTDAESGRFYLHVTFPVQVTSVNAGCDNTNGMINLKLDNTITWDIIQLLNAYGATVASYAGVGYSKLNFSALAEGSYLVQFVYGGYSAIDSFQLNGNYVVAGIAASATEIPVNHTIDFYSNSVHASIFAWDFGDGTIIDGVANPTLSYPVSGTYTVTLTCSNTDGCSASAKMNVVVTEATGITNETIKDPTIFAQGKDISINLNGAINNNAQLQVYNLLGETVYSRVLNYQKETVSMDTQPNGYYIVSVKNDGNTSTKRVILSQ